MIDIKKPLEVRRLLLDFLILDQIKDSSDGISGYELHKNINQTLSTKANSSPFVINYNFSQSQVYRILDELKQNGFVDVKEDVIVNKRLQNLFQINENGRAHLVYLTKILKDIFPSNIVIETTIGDLLSGKQSPFDILFGTIPDEELLPQLKLFRAYLVDELKRIDKTIFTLEENSKNR
jgi:DNA-binding PadR family transcriptional regulator